MAYAAQADLNIDGDRLIELTDSTATPGVIDAALLSQLETQSEAIVNAHLSGSAAAFGFVVPFVDPVPPAITFITAAIWLYRIYRHREIMEMPADVTDDYKLAFQMMDQINAGEIQLGASVPNASGVPKVTSRCERGWTSSYGDWDNDGDLD